MSPRLPHLLLVVPLAFAAALHAASFPVPFDTENTPGAPLPAAEAAARVALPPGFRCTVFAAEPDVQQPIAMTTDPRGRLWVAECYTYSERQMNFHAELRDRVVIFEDTDNDGRFDQRTVFWEGAQRLTSIEVGLGGVWALCLPNLLFIPDRDGDDRPDGAPTVLLDGFEFERARHNVANGLRWGPDGWLYGRHGILGTSQVGTPGTPAAQRTSVNVGIWRYHPQRRAFEVVVEGTTNPWGMDWNEHGEGFFINTVIGHLWQTIPGAHYRRFSGGPDRDPHVYELIDQHADHVHWAQGEVWTDVRKGVTTATSDRGGGHAHSGLLIYQGGQWPAEWRGKLLTLNYHGRRANVERLVPEGSALIGKREPDAFQFADPWFRGIDLIAAPDGGVFVSDWSDAGECHDNDGVHRTSGRIFKLSYGPPAPPPANLATIRSTELVAAQRSSNEWLARAARRALADRAATGGGLRHALEELVRLESSATDSTHRLRALWAQHAITPLAIEKLTALLADRDPHLRRWAVRLLVDDKARALPATTVDKLSVLAANEPDATVRLALASALQRLPAESAAKLAAPLARRAEDATDHNLPLMIWYGVAPLATASDGTLEHLGGDARIPTVARLAARRLTEEIVSAPTRLSQLLARAITAPATIRGAVLDGVAQGLAGRPAAPMPAGWAALREGFTTGAPPAVARRFRELSARFGDARASAELRAIALDAHTETGERRAALQVLMETRAPALREVCEQVLGVASLTAPAAAGLATFDDPAVADRLLAAWPRIAAVDRAAVVGVLVSRVAWAAKLVAALEAGGVHRAQVSAYHARQIRSLGDTTLAARLERAWGRPPAEVTDQQERAQMALWQQRLTPAVLAAADRANGRTLFQSRCASCHRLNGAGGVIGPDLTGAARDNLAYLLENIIAPSAIVPDAYRLTSLTLKDGRTVAGMVRERTAAAATVQTMTDSIVLSAAEIAQEETSAISLMPAGLLDGLGVPQVRDLMAFLMDRENAPP